MSGNEPGVSDQKVSLWISVTTYGWCVAGGA
jgi:hypothetical protein